VGTDSYFVLIVPGLFAAYGTFMLRQFFLGIPKELDEAAMMDGCTRSFMGQYGAEWPVMMAGAMLMIVPMIVFFLFCQRWFVEGLQVGGVKG
jgi:multiple sugar transport system permease protein